MSLKQKEWTLKVDAAKEVARKAVEAVKVRFTITTRLALYSNSTSLPAYRKR